MKVQVTTKWACDFCFKTEDEVETLIAGPRSIAICNECVDLCVEVLTKGPDTKKDGEVPA